MKQKTNRLHFSTRTLAMVLSIVMLIGSIATGSMLNTFAAYLKDNVNSDAVSQAASEGSDIAKSAIPSQNADAANITDNNDAKDAPDLSGFEENEIVRGMKDDLADTGANIDLAETGYDTWYVRGDWEKDGSGVWVDHQITTSQSYSVTLEGGKEYQFVFKANNDQFSAKTTITGTTGYNFNRNDSDAITLRTTNTGTYTFKFNGMSGGETSMQCRIEFPTVATVDTWTVVGDNASLFGTAWAPTATANDMTQSGSTWTWTKNNVQLSAGTIEYKIAKNHAWDTTVPASQNASYTVGSDGTYNVTVTYSGSGNPTMTLTSVTKSTLTVQSNIEHATVKATYNGKTANEGGTISEVPQGATVNVYVTPESGYQCTGISTTPESTTSGSLYSFTMTMPGEDTTVSADIDTVTLKKIYFNNSYTLYGSVYAYVYDKSGTTEDYQYLGKYPGTTMNKLNNSNIWYIEVPGDVDYVKFVSGEGYDTGEMSIPWTSYTYPKYTAPYGHNTAPNTTNGGTWGDYIYGGNNNKRTNEYTVSDGTTMSASNLFTGLTATMYDYYTDGEITASAGTALDTGASGAPNGWIKGIGNTEYTGTGSGWKWNPYTNLNSALSAYANNSSQPKYNVSTPLYFGNLNTKNMGDSDKAVVEAYHNWNLNANNSINLNPNSTAITGLSGKTLANDTIHYYSASDTANQNGAPMAMFDEDFLSGENSEKKALATILRTSSFPVRKEENVDNAVTAISKVYLAPNSDWTSNGARFAAYFFGDNNYEEWVSMSADGNTGKYVCAIPDSANATKVIFCRMNGSESDNNWDNKFNQTQDITLVRSGDLNTAKNLYTITGWDNSCTEGVDITLDGCTTTGGHTYYEYDSTGGKDNAYIENINKTNKTAVINYYNNTNKVHSNSNTDGFFPFNRNDYVPNQNALDYAQDLGFGMKLTIPFTLNENGMNEDDTPQTFDFSGDDDLWVFVDGKLVLDLGGAHARTEGSINFNTKSITANNTQAIASGVDRNGSFATGFNTNPNYVHTMTIYYMERGMFDSNLKFGFSFHAIPNQFWIDKKIRTKDIINAGFYASNGQSGSASNQDDTLTQREGRFISKFEASYQNESFTVEHMYGTSSANQYASEKNYTIDNDTTTYTTGADGQYPIKHDLGNAFIGQFTKDDKFSLKEITGSNNKYVYTPKFSVWDQANNDKAITPGGNNSTGYTFDFSPTTTVSTVIENTNIKARFENYMVAHTLTLKKEITNATDTTTTFTIQVMFDFENDGIYIAYPLHCDVDGERTKLDGEGKITIKAGQILEIEEIPQNAKIQVKEILTDTVSGYRYAGMTLKEGSSTIQPAASVEKGIQFVMQSSDISVDIANKKPDNRYTIKYIYPSYSNLYGNQSYTVSGVFTENELDTYMALDGSGGIRFKTDALKKNFINIKSPYEDNFMQAVSFADATIDDTSEGKGWVNGNYIADATAKTSDDKISVYFYLPYNVDGDTTLIPQESGSTGRVAKIANKAVGSKKIDCFDWYVTDGTTKRTNEWKPEDTTFVNAPLMIYTDVNNDSTVQYFQYWSVKKLSGYGMKAAEYTRCYDYQFNLSLFMDCYIEPVYGSSWSQQVNPPQTYNSYDRFDPEAQIAGDSTKGISVTFLENSRNQYNQNGKGQRDTTNTAMDVIYSDFLLSFNKVDGITQLNTLNPNTKKAGLIIEAVDYLSGSNATGFDASIDYSKEEAYNSDEGTKRTDIINWLQGGTKDSSLKAAKSEFDVKSLDNKNCLQYYYSFNNRACNNDTQELLNTTQNRYKVFRAYSYIGDVSGNTLTNVTLSQPIYFTIYDIGKLYDLADNATGK